MRCLKKICLLPLILLFCACAKTETPVSKNALMLDTVITISVYSDDAQRILSEAVALCERYEALFSKTVPGSDIYRLNHAENQFIDVDDDTLLLLQKSIAYSALSGGAFDTTIGAAIDLWEFDAEKENPALPPPEALEKAVASAGYQQIEFDGSAVRLSKPGAAIDLGAIAKGFIADKIADYLKTEDIRGATIDLGGNMLTVGERPDGSPWVIGLREPFSETGATLLLLDLAEKSVVSSGIYERYFKIGDKLYHHILDTRTGYPLETDLVSVTIISDRSVDGDALSTTAFSLGLEKGLAFIESIPDTEALFITNADEIICTSGVGVGTSVDTELSDAIPVTLLNDRYTFRIANEP
ncbi:MAG: FAD:protein FMN transferase [Clostridiales bacterium]|jgi:thiamine biosynthesis lipoprotein|nr:FAD:protein FMN transferase [Clostridiales bacterium]